MMKWLRHHSKQIMVVVVLLAMFSFVGGSALFNLLAPSQDTDPVGKAFGEVILIRDLRPSQRDTQVLELVAGSKMIWQYDQPDRRMQPEQWHLLAMEAERAGVVVADAEVDEFLNQIATQAPGHLEALRTRHGITPPEVRRAVRRHMQIMKHAEFLGSCSLPSESQVRHHVRDTQDKVAIEFVAIDAEKFLDTTKPVTVAELSAQFEKHKDEVSGESESGYGYKLPRRVKLQYVVADVNKISPHVKVGFEEVKAHWKANKSNYRKTIYEAPASQPATSQATSNPVSTQPVPKSVEQPLTEARMEVERDLRQRNARRLATQAMEKLAEKAQKPWITEKTDEKTGYKAIPAVAREAGFLKRLADELSAEFSIPLEYAESALVTPEDLAAIPGLRNARISGDEGDSIELVDLAFRVPGFFERKDTSDTVLSLQLFQTPLAPLGASNLNFRFPKGFQAGPMPNDRIVLFRVVEAEDVRSPKSLDEVRDKVEHDVRLGRAMQEVEPIAACLFAAAERVGITAAYDLFTSLHKKLNQTSVSVPPPLARLQRFGGEQLQKTLLAGQPTFGPSDVVGVGRSQAFIDACFAMTADGWKPPQVKPADCAEGRIATTRPAQEPAPKVNLVALPAQGKWCVVQLTRFDRVDQGKYESQLRDQAYSTLVGERGAYLLAEWFKPENVEKRCKYERIRMEEVKTPRQGIQAEDDKAHPLLEYGQN